MTTHEDAVSTLDMPGNSYYQGERRNRNEVFQFLRNWELNATGDGSFENHTLNSFSFQNGKYAPSVVSIINRNTASYPDQHIGQFTVLGGNGSREVYGIPVMNESHQVSFNASPINNYAAYGIPKPADNHCPLVVMD